MKPLTPLCPLCHTPVTVRDDAVSLYDWARIFQCGCGWSGDEPEYVEETATAAIGEDGG